MARERQDVVTALAQWRDVDRDHDQAEVQVLAEPALRHLGPQVAVGSGHRTHVDLSLRVTADALDPALLKGAQQLSLEVAVDLADLVEEERPPAARSKRPDRARSAPVKAPRSWPNSSDSRTPGASALQLTATNGFPTRSLS